MGIGSPHVANGHPWDKVCIAQWSGVPPNGLPLWLGIKLELSLGLGLVYRSPSPNYITLAFDVPS